MGLRKVFKIWMFVAVLVIMTIPVVVNAEVDPRDTIPLPGGTDGLLFYYRNVTGTQYNVNGEALTKNAQVESNVALMRYLHYFSIADKVTVLANVIQPFGYIHTVLGPLDQRSSGLGDTIFNVTAWAPPLYSNKDGAYWMGVGAYAVAPTGQYDHDKIINMGANRWNFRLEVAPVIVKYKSFTLEVVGNLDFYTDNDDYTANSLTMEQDPLWSASTHLTYDITKTFWVGASYFYHTGGETTVNGVEQDDKITEHKIMFTTAFMTTPQTQLMLQYATDVEMENGFSTNSIQARFAYFW